MNQQTEIQLALASGIKPIELKYIPVYSCVSGEVAAYRSVLEIHSTKLGELTPAQYEIAADRTDRSGLLTRHAFMYASRLADRMEKDGRDAEWISIRTPIKMQEKLNVAQSIEKLIGEYGVKNPGMICLEFPLSTLYDDTGEFGETLKELKKLGVKSTVTDIGGDFCPIVRLMDMGFDFAVLEPQIRERIVNGEDASKLEGMLAYIRSTGAEIIVTGNQDNAKNKGAEVNSYIELGCIYYCKTNELLTEEILVGSGDVKND